MRLKIVSRIKDGERQTEVLNEATGEALEGLMRVKWKHDGFDEPSCLVMELIDVDADISDCGNLSSNSSLTDEDQR